jgi:exodeoxyribonuclease VII small subunit
MTAKKTNPPQFEKKMAALADVVQKMENTQLPLDAALKEFEKGIKLIRSCQSTLKDAEQKIQMLTQSNELKDFDPDLDDHDN